MKHVFLYFLLFLVGFISVIFYKKYMAGRPTTQVQTPLPTSPPFSLDVPPKSTLTGEVSSFSGVVERQSRSATQASVLRKKMPVLQGEEFWTKENGKAEIRFSPTVEISLEPDSHINFVQMLPTNVVFLQGGGSIRYKKISPTTPIGIRVKNLLVQQHTGDVEISLDDNDPIITINVFKGSVTLAFNNADNISTVTPVDEDSTYTYDYEKREGEITTSE